jgi:hypothetical protein
LSQPSEQLYSALSLAYDFFNRKLFDNSLPNVIFTVQRKKGILGYFSPDRWGSVDGKSCHEIAINPAYLAQSRVVEVLQTLVHEMVHCWQYCHGTPPANAAYHNKEWAYKMKSIGLMPSITGQPGGAITGQSMSDYVIEGGRFYLASKSLLLKEKYRFNWVDRRALPKLFETRVFEESKAEIASSPLVDTDDESLTIDHQEADLSNVISESSTIPWLEGGLDQPFSELLPDGFISEEIPKKPTRYRYMCPSCSTKIYGKPGLKLLCMDCNTVFEWGRGDRGRE